MSLKAATVRPKPGITRSRRMRRTKRKKLMAAAIALSAGFAMSITVPTTAATTSTASIRLMSPCRQYVRGPNTRSFTTTSNCKCCVQ